MQIGLTGVAGFIGINLAKRLLSLNHSVVGIDNYYTGSRSAIEELSQHSNFFFIEHDICNPLPASLDVEYICNLACPASPVHYQKDPLYTIDVSVLGTKHVLQYAHTKKIEAMQFSTSEVYGDPLLTPQAETYLGNVNCTGPRACYDEGKRIAETLCFDYKRQLATRIKVVRIFNTYGPHMSPDDGRVVSTFVLQALRGEALTVFGKGTQTRSFCYIDDLVDGLIAYMFLESLDDISGPINLGSDYEMTILELTEKISKLVPNIRIIHKALPQDDPLQRKPNLSKAQQVLSWNPQTDLDTGLKKTIEWMQNNGFKKREQYAK